MPKPDLQVIRINKALHIFHPCRNALNKSDGNDSSQPQFVVAAILDEKEVKNMPTIVRFCSTKIRLKRDKIDLAEMKNGMASRDARTSEQTMRKICHAIACFGD